MDEANEAYEERLEARREQRRSEEAAMRRDAERYRWLRGGADVPQHSARWPRWEVRHWGDGYWNTLFAEKLDAAIDMAMSDDQAPNARNQPPEARKGRRSAALRCYAALNTRTSNCTMMEQQVMRATIFHTCAPKNKRAGYEAEDIKIVVDLPFVPAPGTMLKLTPGGDYLRVDEVQFDLAGAGLLLHIEEPDSASELWPWREMKREGWLLANAWRNLKCRAT